MRTSEQTDKIIPALGVVVAKLPPLRKGGWNPDTKSKYVKLDAILKIVKPILNSQGIFIMQSAAIVEHIVVVETRLWHASGQWVETTSAVPLVGRMKAGGGRHDSDPQAGGSAISYARRYGVAATLGLVSDDDDDGRAARAPEADARPAAREQKPRLNMDKNKERLAQARAYTPGSFVMPFGVQKDMLKITDEKLEGMRQYARDNGLTKLQLDVEMVQTDRAKQEANASTQGKESAAAGGRGVSPVTATPGAAGSPDGAAAAG
jgi:hypothetical protein